MLVVGWNDMFMTEMGAVGGFILKNNWAGGSHSMSYWMQEISRWDESRICPNSRNPRNWYDCRSIEKCLSEKVQLYADVSMQPLHLKCIHAELCDTKSTTNYFVANASHAGDDMVEMCVFEYDKENRKHRELCLGPYPLDDYAAIFEPVTILKDDPDRCGFYFFPYSLVQRWWRDFPDGFVTDFDTVWHPQSFVANEAKFKNAVSTLDYSLLKQSTKRQNEYVFTGPFPQDMVRDHQVVAPNSAQQPVANGPV